MPERQNAKIVREPLKVVVYLQTCKIFGTVYLELGSRLSDFINNDEMFIPVRDACIETVSGEKIFTDKMKFMNLNKAHILAISPESEQED